uniref:Uncharacterized protein n=1 Tax=viral metagenome TaxID=1070528 RepID=A0A6M3LWT8_9ZZZZ
MKKIIEMKNLNAGNDWAEYEPRPHDADRVIRKLRADEKVNNHGYVYRIRTING